MKEINELIALKKVMRKRDEVAGTSENPLDLINAMYRNQHLLRALNA